MKVILKQDIKTLGEEGDVKNVANGYARNFLLPRGFAVPYNAMTVAYFEDRKAEIDERKKSKRESALGLKDKLEAFTVEIAMPAGPTGKLFGAVTSQTIAEALAKNGFEVERKRIDLPGITIKHTGRYTATVRLYENAAASVQVAVLSQEEAEAARKKAEAEARAAEAAALAASQAAAPAESAAAPAAAEGLPGA